MPTARCGDLTLSYDDLGAGEPSLLFMPGWCASRALSASLPRASLHTAARSRPSKYPSKCRTQSSASLQQQVRPSDDCAGQPVVSAAARLAAVAALNLGVMLTA